MEKKLVSAEKLGVHIICFRRRSQQHGDISSFRRLILEGRRGVGKEVDWRSHSCSNNRQFIFLQSKSHFSVSCIFFFFFSFLFLRIIPLCSVQIKLVLLWRETFVVFVWSVQRLETSWFELHRVDDFRGKCPKGPVFNNGVLGTQGRAWCWVRGLQIRLCRAGRKADTQSMGIGDLCV